MLLLTIGKFLNKKMNDMTDKKFKGVMKLDVRDSVPDWNPYVLNKAPEGSRFGP